MSHRPRKRFGQHFLTDPSAIDAILSAIHARPADHVVEIGPGRGALTHALARQAGQLTLVELDRDLAALLERDFADNPRVTVVSGDALAFDFAGLGNDLRIVGNLPYNISTPLLFHLADFAEYISDMHFMLQKEVVNRITADPGSKAYGRLGVMLQCRFESEPLLDVGPEAFDPPPKVDSSVIRLWPAQSPPDIDDQAQFAALVTQAFSQRRKTLRNSLKGLLDADDITETGINPGARPETLSAAEFATLANAVTANKKPAADDAY